VDGGAKADVSRHVQAAIVASKTVILLLGSLITYLSYKAYRRTGAKPLRALAIGFGIVTAGAILAGGVDLALGAGLLGPGVTESRNLLYGVLVNGVFTAVGFAVITYSLYAE